MEQEQECDESVVYVMDGQCGGGGEEDGGAAAAAACRKVASLYSQKGKKGPNQDAVILCQVPSRSAALLLWCQFCSAPGLPMFNCCFVLVSLFVSIDRSFVVLGFSFLPLLSSFFLFMLPQWGQWHKEPPYLDRAN